MHYDYKMTKNPLQAVFNDLKLFEQNRFCYNYLRKDFTDKTEEKLKNHADIASACFRQASEYYKVASNASISTSPLLYSYALNNLLKGVCYLKSYDDEILDGFKAHGFKVDKTFIKEDALNSKITVMKQKGAVHSLLKLYNNSLIKQEIPLYKILRHIPDIERFYFKLVGSISLIAKSNKNEEEDYTLFGNVIDEEIRKIFISFALMGDPVSNLEDFWCCTTMRTEEYFNKNIFNRNNVFYKDYMNIPEKFEEGVKDINISFYCYLLIMSYGMMVRYNANIWEKYIDKKNSSYSTLIELSIPNAVINFYYQMHYLLFGFYYENDSYSENDIKKMIDASTVDIMNNITKKIKSNSFRNNERVVLP